MQARELVKISNFKHYYFIISKDWVQDKYLTHPETKEIAFDYKLKKGKGCGLLQFLSNEKNADVDGERFYDVGYSFQQIALSKLCCEDVAKYIDLITYADTKTKIFKIKRLENCDGILYVHLILNKRQ